MKSVCNRARLVLVILLIPGMAGAQVSDNNQNEKEFTMSVAERNKEIVRNLYEQSLNKRNFESLREYISEDFTGAAGKKGPEAFKERVDLLILAFPDIRWNIQELFGEDHKVLIRWKVEGTHTGAFMNIPATGEPVSNDGIGIYELNDGKIISARVQTDRLGFLQQLGVLPDDFIQSLNPGVLKDRVIFIDKFLVPTNVKEEFIARMNHNRDYIKGLPGFVHDNAYEQAAADETLVIITVAVWEDEEALNQAKEAVQSEYKRTGFNPAEFMERLKVKMERGTYRKLMY